MEDRPSRSLNAQVNFTEKFTFLAPVLTVHHQGGTGQLIGRLADDEIDIAM